MSATEGSVTGSSVPEGSVPEGSVPEGSVAEGVARPRTAAIVGCGDISAMHGEAIAAIPGITLVAVCDTDPERLRAATDAYGVPGFTDHRRLLAEMRPDVVHITTPHDQHVPVALDALAAGVNVLTEKPVAHTLADAERLVAAAERTPAKVGVCFQNRYNATSQAARTLLDSGELGKVLGASATVLWERTPDYYLARPWRGTWAQSGGGLLINQAIHTVDLLQWLLGEVTEVSGHASTRALGHVIEVEDTAEVLLRHAGGARSVFYGTLANVGNAPVTLEIVTERATLALRGDLTITYDDGRVEVVPERKAASVGRSYWGISHELLIRDFYAHLDEPGPFWISPAEGAKSLRILADVYARSFGAAVTG